MVDMRRDLGKVGRSMSLTNLTSTVITRLECNAAESFENTLGRVKAIMDEKKVSDIGLNGFMKLDVMFRTFGNRIANRQLKRITKNPLIGMTNVGILDSTQISFGGLRPSDAYLCGSIKYKPHFQLAMSSYEGELTFSVNLYGSVGDRDRILSFFDAIQAELPN
jgi:NRPS condensation-like uncharacterized protein